MHRRHHFPDVVCMYVEQPQAWAATSQRGRVDRDHTIEREPGVALAAMVARTKRVVVPAHRRYSHSASVGNRYRRWLRVPPQFGEPNKTLASCQLNHVHRQPCDRGPASRSAPPPCGANQLGFSPITASYCACVTSGPEPERTFDRDATLRPLIAVGSASLIARPHQERAGGDFHEHHTDRNFARVFLRMRSRWFFITRNHRCDNESAAGCRTAKSRATAAAHQPITIKSSHEVQFSGLTIIARAPSWLQFAHHDSPAHVPIVPISAVVFATSRSAVDCLARDRGPCARLGLTGAGPWRQGWFEIDSRPSDIKSSFASNSTRRSGRSWAQLPGGGDIGPANR